MSLLRNNNEFKENNFLLFVQIQGRSKSMVEASTVKKILQIKVSRRDRALV